MSQVADELKACFEKIHRERMQGMSFVNRALQVETIGFRKLSTGEAGVLITPWSMNLVFVEPDYKSSEAKVGRERDHRYPAGEYRFITNSEPGFGVFEVCSLFSTMFEFSDQQTAVETAEAIIEGLFQHEKQDAEEKTLSRRQLLRGKWR